MGPSNSQTRFNTHSFSFLFLCSLPFFTLLVSFLLFSSHLSCVLFCFLFSSLLFCYLTLFRVGSAIDRSPRHAPIAPHPHSSSFSAVRPPAPPSCREEIPSLFPLLMAVRSIGYFFYLSLLLHSALLAMLLFLQLFPLLSSACAFALNKHCVITNYTDCH